MTERKVFEEFNVCKFIEIYKSVLWMIRLFDQIPDEINEMKFLEN